MQIAIYFFRLRRVVTFFLFAFNTLSVKFKDIVQGPVYNPDSTMDTYIRIML